MANDISADFDLGPLTWVRDEIDQALAKGLTALSGFAEQPDDRTLLKHAQTHIHQAAGAVQIVGLDGAITLIEEVERHLALLETMAPEAQAPHVEAIGAACRRLTRYLNDLTDGEPPVTLKLYPEYEALTRLRGADGASPTDLFFPDLSRRPPRRAEPDRSASDRMPANLRVQRRNYQLGLLAWLRGDPNGIAAMRQAVQAIEDAYAGSVIGAFWWSVGGFLASAAAKGILPSYTVKQLCGRIDLQIRRFVEGSTKVADRLRREVLYHIAISEPVDQRVREVQDLYGLPAMLPQRVEARQIDLDRFQPVLRRAQEVIAAIKDNWLKFTGGRREALAPIAHSLSELKTLASGLHEPALTDLVVALEAVSAGASRSGNVPDVLAMEFATGMLLTEDAISHFARLSDKFPRQVEAMRRRLEFAQSGVLSLPGAEEDLLDDMARRAQERMLLAQVAREIQGNLRHIEKVLDAFFRDAGERSELPGLAAYTKQIQGALRMLNLGEADELLQSCQKQIDSYAAGAPASSEDLELLAESLSSLGFYIEAVEQQRPDAARLLEPTLRRRLGPEHEVIPETAEHSVEVALEERREDLPEILDRFRAAPQDPALRAELGAQLQTLKQDAELVADEGFSARAAGALAALADPEHPAVDLLAKLENLSPETASVAPGPSAETIRLLEAGEAKLDAELGEIFLTEATEVLGTVAQQLDQCERDAQDHEALRTIRRGFHTLKGSGRMVGLLELGETAYMVEKVLNRWLDEERPNAPDLLEMLRQAERDFRGWVAELQRSGAVHVDDRLLARAIESLEAAHPPVVTTVAMTPELTVGASGAEAQVPVIETIELAAPVEEAVAPEATLAAPETGFDVEPAPTEVFVGEVRVSATLYRILLEETANHLETLRHEHHAMEFDPFALPADAMIRAAHTLTGIHRTAGFAPVALTAQAMERALLSLQHQEPRPEIALAVIADATNALAALVDFIGMRQRFGSAELQWAEQAREELDALAKSIVATSHDSEMLAAQVALADEAALADQTPDLQLPVSEEFVADTDAVAADATAAEATAAEAAAAEAATAEATTAEATTAEATTAEATTAEATAAEAIAAEATAAEATAAEATAAEATAAEAAAAEAEATPAGVVAADTGATDISWTQPQPTEPALGPVPEPESASVSQPAPPASFDAMPSTAEVPESVVQATPAFSAPPETTLPPLPASTMAPEPPSFEILPSTIVAAEGFAGQPLLVPMASAPGLAPGPISEDPTRTVADVLATVRDDLDAQVLPIFLEEAQELFPHAGALLRDWRRAPAEEAHALELRRTLHTLKGSARMAGAMRLGELTHLMESRLLFGERTVVPSTELFDALDSDLDQLAGLLDQLNSGTSGQMPVAPAAVVEATQHLRRATDLPAPTDEIGGATTVADEPVAEQEIHQRAMVRVRSDVIDRLVNETGEVAIARARIEGELRSLKSNLLELTNSVIRLRSQVREIEIQAETQIQSRMSLVQDAEAFDPLEFDRYTRFQEMTRSLAEGVNDVATVQQSLLKNLDDADAALLAQARMSREVQQQLLAVRTVPFASLSERLYRVLRQTAKELDKKANLEIRGGQTELDRGVLEKLVAPLEHLLRNAIDHGIETRAARAAAHKPEIGEIAITVRQERNEIALTLADDGQGLPLSEIRTRAVQMGLLKTQGDPTQAQLIEAIFTPGFSTAGAVTQISGRGIGMDVVKNGITSLGGRIEVATTAGKGTIFTLYLPLTLAVTQAVLVRAAGRIYALPAALVEQVQQIKSDSLMNLYLAREVRWQARMYPFFYLPQLLGNSEFTPETQRYNPVLLLRSANQYVSIHVDEMLGNQEIVIKNIGVQLARLPGLSGATVLGTGEIVLILNPVQLVDRQSTLTSATAADGSDVPAQVAPISPPHVNYVLVVDDSLTVRKITSRLLIREGFEVATARDGVDALQVLAEHIPDVILLDIEMPRMDGFEFAKTVKNDPRLKMIPIIMITSRTAPKHRARAAEVGVETYLGKPFQEEELLRHIRRAVKPAQVAETTAD